MLETALGSQLLSSFVELSRRGRFKAPTKNTLKRFFSATGGAFVPTFIVLPLFLYLGAPAVFKSFMEWINTVVISVNIAVVIILTYASIIFLFSAGVGFLVSESTPDEVTM